MPEWWQKTMPGKGIVLGLDLQGGLHLVYEVEGQKAVETSAERYASLIRDNFAKKKIQADVKRNGLDIEITPGSQEVSDILRSNYPLLDTNASGQSVIARIDDKEAAKIKDNAVDQALETIRNRVDQFGVAEPNVYKQGTDQIVIQLPGIKNPQEAISFIKTAGRLEFKLVDSESDISKAVAGSVPEGREILYGEAVGESGRISFRVIVLFLNGVLSRRVPVRPRASPVNDS